MLVVSNLSTDWTKALNSLKQALLQLPSVLFSLLFACLSFKGRLANPNQFKLPFCKVHRPTS